MKFSYFEARHALDAAKRVETNTGGKDRTMEWWDGSKLIGEGTYIQGVTSTVRLLAKEDDDPKLAREETFFQGSHADDMRGCGKSESNR